MANGEGLSKYEGTSTGDLWKIYESLHEVNPKTGVNKPRSRERTIRLKHRKPLVDIIRDELGKDSDGLPAESLDHVKGESAKKKKAEAILTKLVHLHYKTDFGESVKKPDSRKIDEILQLAGIQGGHYQLVKDIMDAENLAYDQLPQDSNLRRLMDYVSAYKHRDGHIIAEIKQELAKPERQDDLKRSAGQTMDRIFKATAGAGDVFGAHQVYLTEKLHDYQVQRETTAAKPAKKAA